MRITDVRATILQAPIPETSRVRSGVGLKYARTSVFAEVLTDEGLTGLGTCLGNPPGALKSIIEDMIAPTLRGQDPFDTEGLWEMVYTGRIMRMTGPRSIGVGALSGVDTALWDIKGKALGVPIYKLLGGAARKKVRAYASSIYWQAPETAAQEARRYVDAGYTCVKLKVGADLRRDMDSVAAIRQAIGNDVDLLVDANLCYTPKLALRVVRELESQNVFWFEEPIPFDDVEGHKMLTEATSVRIATGENMYTRFGFRDLINQRAADIVQPDIGRCGGITEAKKIATLAGANGLLFVPHSFGDAVSQLSALHIIASSPEAMIMEMDITYNPLRSELSGHLLDVRDGYIELPTEPGLGVALTQEIRERYPYKAGLDLSLGASPALGMACEDLADRNSP
jgi:D-galactarolactone cycloisomerase